MSNVSRLEYQERPIGMESPGFPRPNLIRRGAPRYPRRYRLDQTGTSGYGGSSSITWTGCDCAVSPLTSREHRPNLETRFHDSGQTTPVRRSMRAALLLCAPSSKKPPHGPALSSFTSWPRFHMSSNQRQGCVSPATSCSLVLSGPASCGSHGPLAASLAQEISIPIGLASWR